MKPKRIIRLPEVANRVGLSRTRIYELERAGKFPKRRHIADRATGWIESEIDEFIDSRPVVDPGVTTQITASLAAVRARRERREK